MKNKAMLLIIIGCILNTHYLLATYSVELENVHYHDNKICFSISMIDTLQIQKLDFTIDEIDDTLKTLSEYDYRRIKDTIVITFDPEESYHSSEPVEVKVDYDPYHFFSYRWVRNPYGKADYCLQIKPSDVERLKYLRVKIDKNQILTSLIKKR